VQDTKK
jgi:hypothetical protein